jgi:hypothetical protein
LFNSLDYPIFIFAASLLIFWIFAWIGSSFRKRQGNLTEDSNDDFKFVLNATLALLGLIIGFTLLMAVNRYDQRKTREEEETNAIGTEFLRTNLLPAADAARVRALLKSYLDQRVLHYESRNEEQVRQIDTQTARLQAEMWSVVATIAAAQPTPVAPLVLSGMNDVLNSQGYAEAAWRNRIPIAVWTLLITISVFCNLLIGYSAHERSAFLFLVLPIALSIAFFLIADIDSPRGGIIRVHPQNLKSLVESLHSQ